LPSCVVDGVLEPRNTLENVFETSIQNTSTNDTQHLEIDLSGDSIISSIIYTGRGDAETRTIYDINSVAWNLTQVERVKGMRVEIRDTLGKLTFGGPGVTAATFPTVQVNKQILKITNQLFTVNADLGSSAEQKDTILIPNIVAYKKISEFFRNLPPLVRPPPSTEISPDFVPDVNPVENNKELINSVYVKSYKPTHSTMDLSNNIFPVVVGDHPRGDVGGQKVFIAHGYIGVIGLKGGDQRRGKAVVQRGIDHQLPPGAAIGGGMGHHFA
jgi:hypothetical protein